MSLTKKSSVDQYKSNQISTVSQGKLIVMLYEGAIRFIQIAIESNTPRKYDIVNNNIIKAQDIITELLLSLNVENENEISKNLLSIYIYLKKRLLEANMNKDTKIMEEIRDHLFNLKNAWEEIEKKERNKSINDLNVTSARSNQYKERISFQG